MTPWLGQHQLPLWGGGASTTPSMSFSPNILLWKIFKHRAKLKDTCVQQTIPRQSLPSPQGSLPESTPPLAHLFLVCLLQSKLPYQHTSWVTCPHPYRVQYLLRVFCSYHICWALIHHIHMFFRLSGFHSYQDITPEYLWTFPSSPDPKVETPHNISFIFSSFLQLESSRCGTRFLSSSMMFVRSFWLRIHIVCFLLLLLLYFETGFLCIDLAVLDLVL